MSLAKIRVGRVTVNTHIFFLGLIGVEMLSLQIKSNPKIKGALVNDTESLISQYADDTFLVLDGCETSLGETLICFETFIKLQV